MSNNYYLNGKSSIFKNGVEIVKFNKPIQSYSFLGFDSCAYFILLPSKFIKVEGAKALTISESSHCNYTSYDKSFGLYIIDKDRNPQVVAVHNGELFKLNIYSGAHIYGRYCSYNKYLFVIQGQNFGGQTGLFIYDELGTHIIHRGYVDSYFYFVNHENIDNVFFVKTKSLFLYRNNNISVLSSEIDYADKYDFRVENDDVIIESGNQIIFIYESDMNKNFLTIPTPFDLQLHSDKHYLFYSDNGSKESFFISCVYGPYMFERFNNQFQNDISKNYYTLINRCVDYSYLSGIQKKNRFSIFGSDIMDIIYNTDYNTHNRLLENNVSVHVSPDRKTIRHLMQQSGLSEAQLFWYLKSTYYNKLERLSNESYKYLYKGTIVEAQYNLNRQYYAQVYQKEKQGDSLTDKDLLIKKQWEIYNEEFNQAKLKNKAKFETILINNGYYEIYPNKWKSEFDLFIWIKKYYSNAVFQYHPRWLKSQSLDIYIPDLCIAIEYQGVQHYHPVGFFGGDETYLATSERDLRKQRRCAENGAKLFYWSYEIPINQVTVEEFIKKFK